MISSLLRSRKFWLATFAVVQTVVFNLVPTFPQEVWLAIDALVVALILAYTVEEAAIRKEDRFNSFF